MEIEIDPDREDDGGGLRRLLTFRVSWRMVRHVGRLGQTLRRSPKQ
jgi:hypothetical protein